MIWVADEGVNITVPQELGISCFFCIISRGKMNVSGEMGHLRDCSGDMKKMEKSSEMLLTWSVDRSDGGD